MMYLAIIKGFSGKRAGEVGPGQPAKAEYALRVGEFYPLWQDGGGFKE